MKQRRESATPARSRADPGSMMPSGALRWIPGQAREDAVVPSETGRPYTGSTVTGVPSATRA